MLVRLQCATNQCAVLLRRRRDDHRRNIRIQDRFEIERGNPVFARDFRGCARISVVNGRERRQLMEIANKILAPISTANHGDTGHPPRSQYQMARALLACPVTPPVDCARGMVVYRVQPPAARVRPRREFRPQMSISTCESSSPERADSSAAA